MNLRIVAIFFFIGILEWFLATQRMWAVSKGHGNIACLIVLLENLTAFFVMFMAIENVNNWPMAVSYSLGGALGTWINMKLPI